MPLQPSFLLYGIFMGCIRMAHPCLRALAPFTTGDAHLVVTHNCATTVRYASCHMVHLLAQFAAFTQYIIFHCAALNSLLHQT